MLDGENTILPNEQLEKEEVEANLYEFNENGIALHRKSCFSNFDLLEKCSCGAEKYNREVDQLTEEKRREEAESREKDIANGWSPDL